MATDKSEAAFSLRQLATEAGVTPRTVHYYIQEGVLPPSGSLGSHAQYSAGHLARLRLIKRLQKEHLPLMEIAGRMRSLTDRQVEGLLGEAQRVPTSSPSSALDYVSRLLGRAPAPPDDGMPLRKKPDRSAAAPPPRAQEHSQWERIALGPDVELHVRRPLSRAGNRQLERLLESARQILQKED